MRRRWWLFMSRRTLRRKLEAKRQDFNNTANLIRNRGGDNAEFYSGAAWGVMTVMETLFFKSFLSDRQVRKQYPESVDD